MNYFTELQNSALIEWFLTSMWGFPTFIALHSVGMAFVVGLSFIVSLRYFGFFGDVSHSITKRLINIAWCGFALNVCTGLFLLASRLSEYLFDPTFLVKMSFVVIAVISLRLMQRDFIGNSDGASKLKRRVIPVVASFAWIAAITAGRWIAYISGIYG